MRPGQPYTHPQPPVAIAPFQYNRPYVAFDWKELYGLNLEDALSRNDFQIFGPIAGYLAFGDIETPFRQGNVSEDVMRTAAVQQYLVQYLLYMQDVLMYEIALARANPPQSPDVQALIAEREALRKQLRIERARRQTDAMMLRLASVNPETVNMLFRCHICNKVFADYRFLVAHYEKRHEGIKPIQPPPFRPAPVLHANHCCSLHTTALVQPPAPEEVPVPAPVEKPPQQTSIQPDPTARALQTSAPPEPPSDIFADYISDTV